MNKCIILSVQPQWLHKILTGKKTIEIRKSMPQCEYPIDVYLYCTKGKPYLYESFSEDWWWNDGVLEPLADRYGVRLSDFKLPEKFHDSESRGWNNLLNGFILAKFTLNKVVEILPFKKQKRDKVYITYFSRCGDVNWGNKTCLNQVDFENYLGLKTGYGWHIENLEIFDKPMDLKEFDRGDKDELCKRVNGFYQCSKCKYSDKSLMECKLKVFKAPQSWAYSYKE